MREKWILSFVCGYFEAAIEQLVVISDYVAPELWDSSQKMNGQQIEKGHDSISVTIYAVTKLMIVVALNDFVGEWISFNQVSI